MKYYFCEYIILFLTGFKVFLVEANFVPVFKLQPDLIIRAIEKRKAVDQFQSYVLSFGVKMVCIKGVPRVTGTLGKANNHFDPIQTGSGAAPLR